jgi:putative transposase
MLRAYKFRAYPSEEQITQFEKTLSSCCFLYNSALQERKYACEFHQQLNYNDQQNELPELKKALPEYSKIYSQVLQDVLRRLDKSFKGFFNGVKGYPRFKPTWRYNSFTYSQSGFKVLPNGHIQLSKIGKLRVFMHRKLLGKIKTLTIKRDRVGDWFAILTAESPDVNPKEIKSVVTIDAGLEKLITLSSGEYVEPPKFFRKSEKRLARVQRHLSSKKLGSKNREKARVRVAKVHRDLNTTFDMLEQIRRGTPESTTPVEMRPLLVETSASRVREAGSP